MNYYEDTAFKTPAYGALRGLVGLSTARWNSKGLRQLAHEALFTMAQRDMEYPKGFPGATGADWRRRNDNAALAYANRPGTRDRKIVAKFLWRIRAEAKKVNAPTGNYRKL